MKLKFEIRGICLCGIAVAWKQSVFQSIFWESNIPKSSPKELLRAVNVVEWIV